MEQHDHKNTVQAFLNTHPLGTLATTAATGAPQLSILYFFYDEALNCYFVTKAATRKLQNILNNPESSLIAFDEHDLSSVEIEGTVSVLTQPEDVIACITRFQEVASTQRLDYWVPPASQIDGTQYVACKLTPRAVHFKKFATKIDGSEHMESFTITP